MPPVTLQRLPERASRSALDAADDGSAAQVLLETCRMAMSTNGPGVCWLMA